MTRLSALLGLSAVLGCVLAWELLPGDDGPSGAAPPLPAAAGFADAAGIDTDHLDGIARTVLQRPLLSPGRRPAPAGTVVAPAAAVEVLPRLSGIVIGPAGARAILDDGSGRQRSAATGDSIGRFKIGAIVPGEVSLVSPDGERVLRPKSAK